MKLSARKQKRILIGAVLIMFIGLVALYLVLPRGNASPSQPVMKQVYYAAETIPQGTMITSEMLGTFSIPQEYVNDVMFEVGEEDELIGMLAYLTLEQGVLITAPTVISPEELFDQNRFYTE